MLEFPTLRELYAYCDRSSPILSFHLPRIDNSTYSQPNSAGIAATCVNVRLRPMPPALIQLVLWPLLEARELFEYVLVAHEVRSAIISLLTSVVFRKNQRCQHASPPSHHMAWSQALLASRLLQKLVYS